MLKFKLFSAFIAMLFWASAFCQNDSAYLSMADNAYDAKEPEKAKELYLKAAAMGNPEAHFALYYKYSLPYNEQLYHLSEAAKGGHLEALSYVYEKLLCRANNLRLANPQLAYEIYETAFKNNPGLDSASFQPEFNIIKQCIEPGPFDVDAFLKKYNISEDSLDGFYSIWELAAEASKGGRFGKPNPKLILQLVIRGGSVPAEYSGAVADAYYDWKENKVEVFKICDYVTSGIGMGYCENIEMEKTEALRKHRVSTMAPKLKNHAGSLLAGAYKTACAFIRSKAAYEEGSGGTGYVAWVLESEMQQRDAYLALIQKVNRDSLPEAFTGNEDSDKKLNETYQNVLQQLKNKFTPTYTGTTDSEVIETQLLWIPYRDSTAKILHRIMPKITESNWKNWLTEVRIEDLAQILKNEE